MFAPVAGIFHAILFHFDSNFILILIFYYDAANWLLYSWA